MDTKPHTNITSHEIKEKKVTHFLKKAVKAIGWVGVALAFLVLWLLLGGDRFGCTNPELRKE